MRKRVRETFRTKVVRVGDFFFLDPVTPCSPLHKFKEECMVLVTVEKLPTRKRRKP